MAEAIAVVGACDVFVGVDSGLLHAAAMFRKPLVGLFSHLEVTRRLTLAERFVALQPALACFPCGDSWPGNTAREDVAVFRRPSFRPEAPNQPPSDRVAAATPERVAHAVERIMRTVSSRTFGPGGGEGALRRKGSSAESVGEIGVVGGGRAHTDWRD